MVGDFRVALFFLPFRRSSVLLHPSPSPSLPREGGLVLADRGLLSRVKRPGPQMNHRFNVGIIFLLRQQVGGAWNEAGCGVLYCRNAVFTPCSKVDFTVIEDL